MSIGFTVLCRHLREYIRLPLQAVSTGSMVAVYLLAPLLRPEMGPLRLGMLAPPWLQCPIMLSLQEMYLLFRWEIGLSFELSPLGFLSRLWK